MKVAKGFYCIKSKKNYKAGDEYKGKRTDLSHLMVGYKEPIKKETKVQPKAKIEKK